jgi:hypothetical protein
MFVGHGFAAAIVAVAFVRVAVPEFRDHEFRLALAAFLFGALPDVDMVYAFAETPFRLTNDLGRVLSVRRIRAVFWSATGVHRGLTHSLLAGSVVGLYCYRLGRDRRAYRRSIRLRELTAGQLDELTSRPTRRLLLVLLALSVFATGVGEWLVFWLLVGVASVATVRIVETELLAPEHLLVASLAGLLSHPLGDLWLGTAFRVFAPLPFETTQFEPLLGVPGLQYPLAFGIEAGVCLVGLVVLAAAYRGWGLRRAVVQTLRPRQNARFVAGVAAAVALLYLPVGYAPLQRTYELTILGLALPPLFCVAADRRRNGRRSAVATLYRFVLTEVVVAAAICAAIVAAGAPPAETLAGLAWERYLELLEYLRSIYDGRGLDEAVAAVETALP